MAQEKNKEMLNYSNSSINSTIGFSNINFNSSGNAYIGFNGFSGGCTKWNGK